MAEGMRYDVSIVGGGRLKDRMTFGGDYPLFSHERLVGDRRKEGNDDVLDRVFYKNAENSS
jgi:predicted TIM-barrel fold metal-dependent hydrolase